MRTLDDIHTDVNTYVNDPAALHVLADEALKLDTDLARALADQALGIANSVVGNYDTALKYFDSAVQRYESQGRPEGLASTWANIGLIHKKRGDLVQSIQCHRQALEVFQEHGLKDPAAKQLLQLGMLYRLKGDLPGAREFFDASRRLFTDVGNTVGVMEVHIAMGNLYISEGNYDLAMSEYDRALLFVDKNSQQLSVALVYGNMGIVHQFTGKYDHAFVCYFKAMEIHEALPDPLGAAKVYGNIGAMYSEIGDYVTARIYLNKALSIDLSLGTRRNAANVIGNIGCLFHEEGDYVSALDHHERARSLFDELECREDVKCQTVNMVMTLLAMGETERAGMLHHDLAVDNISSPDVRAQFYLNQGDLRRRNNEDAGSMLSYQKALDISRDASLPKKQLAALRRLRDAALAVRDLESYVVHNTEYLRIDEELQISRARQQASALEATRAHQKERHEREKEQQKRELLEERLAMTTLQLASQVELISVFRRDLQSIIKESTDPYHVLSRIATRLRDLPCEEVDWIQFEKQFIELHPDFTTVLIEKYPNLTRQEVKMCQLARIGLKSHEVARILCLSERSVDSHRYNIRKKLGLQTKEGLTDFLRTM